MHIISALTDQSSQLRLRFNKCSKYYTPKIFKSERQLLGIRQKGNQQKGSYLILKEILQK